MQVLEALLGLNGVWQVETLLRLLWQSFIVVSCCALAARVARGMSPRVQHAIWVSGLATLLILPFVPRAAFEFNLIVEPPPQAAAVDNRAVLNPPREYVAGLLAKSGLPVRTDLLTADTSDRGPGVFGWLFIAWGAVAVILLMHLGIGILQVRNLLRRGSPPPLRLRRIFDRENTSSAMLVLADTAVPFTFGWRKTIIALPAEAVLWSEQSLLAVLRHELIHIRRGDWLRQIVVQIVARVYWINPFVKRAANRASLFAEIACDQAVIASGVSRRSYASQLVEASLARVNPSTLKVALTFVRASEVERRIRYLAPAPRPPNPVLRGAFVLLLMAAAFTTSLFSRPTLGECSGLPVRVEFNAR